MTELTKQEGKQLEITEKDGKTTIVFRKAILKGRVSSSEVLNTILIAAKMQAEYYIKKLASGSPLEIAEVKALKDLGDITKLEATSVEEPNRKDNSILTEVVSKNIYDALTEKLSSK
jgi:hypothetical protein